MLQRVSRRNQGNAAEEEEDLEDLAKARKDAKKKAAKRPAALGVVPRLAHRQMQLPAPEVPTPEGKVAKMILVGTPR